MRTKIYEIGFLAFTAVALDQASKAVIVTLIMQPPRIIEITPFFNLTLGFNTGVSFGLFGDSLKDWPSVLVLVTLLIAFTLLVWAWRTPSRMERLGLSTVAGGALGNIVDRLRQGKVTDFLDLHWAGWHWPTFNLADVSISFGVLLMIWSAFRDQNQAREIGASN